ncbi:MAG: PD40 domain-containing protein [Myxococcales bacterium]|nr:PD40 domain-containing protein [Myxococcales bacterium]
MSRAVLVILLCGGCSAKLPDVTLAGDGRGAETSADAADAGDAGDARGVEAGGDTTPVVRCDWSKAGFSLSAPQPLSQLDSASEEAEPFLSADGRTLLFASTRSGGSGKWDDYIATRTDTSDPMAFGNVRELAAINSPLHETRLAVSSDGRTFYLSAETATASEIYIAELGSSGGDATTLVRADFKPIAAINAIGIQKYDPHPSYDNLRLYFIASDINGGGSQTDILVSSRASPSDPFGAPVAVMGVNSGSIDANPTLTADELTIVFNSSRPSGQGSNDLYYATRATRQDAFGAPQPVPTLNSPDSDTELHITLDGCEVYFTSNRGGGKQHIYHSRYVAP